MFLGLLGDIFVMKPLTAAFYRDFHTNGNVHIGTEISTGMSTNLSPM